MSNWHGHDIAKIDWTVKQRTELDDAMEEVSAYLSERPPLRVKWANAPAEILDVYFDRDIKTTAEGIHRWTLHRESRGLSTTPPTPAEIAAERKKHEQSVLGRYRSPGQLGSG